MPCHNQRELSGSNSRKTSGGSIKSGNSRRRSRAAPSGGGTGERITSGGSGK